MQTHSLCEWTIRRKPDIGQSEVIARCCPEGDDGVSQRFCFYSYAVQAMQGIVGYRHLFEVSVM